MMRPTIDSFKDIAGDIKRKGFAVVREFVDGGICAPLAAECRELHAAGALTAAGIGRADSRRERADIRGDMTRWLEPAALTAAQQPYWQAMEALRGVFNQALLLGLAELEAHYALYAPRSRYARHRDRFRDDDARVLSSVLYLNEGWRREHGGALRLYLPDGARQPQVDIYPDAGTLVLFLSSEFEHEVLPATRERLSIAGWFRRRG